MLTFVGGEFAHNVKETEILFIILASLLVPITFYVLRSIGLFKLAKRKKLKCAFVAWIPVAWVYVICKLISEYKIFGLSIGKYAWLITTICVLAGLLMAAYEFLLYFPFIGNYLAGRNIYIVSSGEDITANMVVLWDNFPLCGEVGAFKNPYSNLIAVKKILYAVNLLSNLLGLIQTVLMISLYVHLFRKYWPQHYMLGAILSLFGLDGPFVFAIRNKEPVNYMDYLSKRYRAYGNPYGNPYNPYGRPNDYGPNQGSGAYKQPDEPFGDFEDKKNKKPEDPFSDF